MNVTRGTTLLIGFDPRTALAVARSLHCRGVRVVVATLGAWETPIWSRAVEAYLHLPCAEENSPGFLPKLLEAIAQYQIDTLIPLTDRALSVLAPHQNQLRERVRLLAPTSQQTAIVLDKTLTAQLAVNLCIPVPATVILESLQGLSDVEDGLKFPVFLKPQNKSSTSLSQVTPGPDVFRCDDVATLRSRLRDSMCASGGKFLVQERMPGDDVGLAVVMRAGEVVSIFQYRALRLWPATGGVCVASRSETVHTAMADSAIRLLRTLGWEGVAQLDFRHDPQTDRFALLEVNGRFWGSTAAAVASGIDMPWVVWQLTDASGEQPRNYPSGQRVRWLEGDLRRLLDLIKTLGAWSQLGPELGSFLWDFRPTVKGMCWSWRDPFAGFHSAATFLYWWCAARFRQTKRPAPQPQLTLQPAAMIHRSGP